VVCARYGSWLWHICVFFILNVYVRLKWFVPGTVPGYGIFVYFLCSVFVFLFVAYLCIFYIQCVCLWHICVFSSEAACVLLWHCRWCHMDLPSMH
jgi:hypothetical protein